MEGSVAGREREDRSGPATDLEALRFDVVVRDGVTEPVQRKAENEGPGARADERAAGSTGCCPIRCQTRPRYGLVSRWVSSSKWSS